MPDPIPIQYRVGGVAKPLQSYGEVVKVLQIPFQRLAHDVGAASLEFHGSRVQRFDEFMGHVRAYLMHTDTFIRFHMISINVM